MPDSPSEQVPVTKPKKKRNWKRRLRWTVIVLLSLGILIRLLVPLTLPMVLRKVAGIYGMNCEYDRLQLNLFSGDAGIWGLRFEFKDGGNPILATDYCHGNVSVLNLLRGRLDVWRVEADGVDVNIDRNEDGHIPLLDRFIAASGKSVPISATPTTKPATAPGEIDLSSPLKLDALRLNHIRVHIHDRGIKPAIDSELAMDLRLSDLGAPDRKARFEMDMSIDPMLDNLKITGEGQSGGKNLEADFNVLVRGIRLKPAAAYLAPLGIVPIADGITLTAAGKIHTAAAANNLPGFTASVAFDHLAAIVDRKEAMALDHLRIDADQIDTKAVHFSRFDFDGARATGARGADGNIQVLGLEYNPALVVHEEPTTKPVEVTKTSPASPSPLLEELQQLPWSVGEVALRNGQITLHDDAVSPPVDLAIVADELSAKSIIHDPKNPNTAIALLAKLHLPNLIRDITATGTALPFADKKTFNGAVEVTGIKPDAIKPYLDQAGIESTLKAGHFTAALEADATLGETITANAKVTRFSFGDDTPLFALKLVNLAEVKLNSKTADLDIGTIELTGPGIRVVRDATGQFAALGFRTRAPNAGSEVRRRAGSVAEPAPKSQTPPATQRAFTLASLPHVTLHKFSWKGIRIDLEDQAADSPTNIALDSIGVEATDLTTVPGQNNLGRFRAWITSPQIAKRFEVFGTLNPDNSGIRLHADVDGEGLNTSPFAPCLKPFGVEPNLYYGQLTCGVDAKLDLGNAGPAASLTLRQLHFNDGPTELAGIDALLIQNLSLRDGTLGTDRIYILRPRATAWRAPDGSLQAGGFRLLPPVPTQAPTVETSPGPSVIKPPSTSSAAPSDTSLAISIPKLTVTNAALTWIDNAARQPVRITGIATVDLENLVVGKEAEPAKFTVDASATDCVANATISGQINAGPSRQAAVLLVQASGLRAGPLATYFPPGSGSILNFGYFATKVMVAHSSNKDGGMALELRSGPLDLRDGGMEGIPLFHLDSATVEIPRLDLPDNALNIQELSVTGVTSHAERLPDGRLTCLGFTLGEPSGPVSPATQPAAAPAVVQVPSVSVPTTGPSVKKLMEASHRPIPNVTLDKLDLNVANFMFTDLARPQAAPVVISDLQLKNVEPINVLGKDYAAKPPIKLHFETKISPIVDRVAVDVTASPFVRQPTLVVDSLLTGIHGEGLTDLVPELKSQIDGSRMTDGTSSAHLEADAKWDRKGPLDFDISRGMDADFVLSKVEHRASPNGPILAGVEEVRAENIRLDPRQPLVRFKTIEITKPIGRIKRDETGISAAGWVYKIATTQPSTQPTTQLADASVKTKTPVPTTEPAVEAPAPKGEVRIDKLLISGLDFKVEDDAVNPPLVVPLNDLDVEVRNISSLAPFEERPPMRFSALVGADKVKLARRGSSPVVYEDRDLFSQVTASGELSLYPKPHGWVKESVSAFELASLQGEAKSLGEDLTAGTYDMAVDLQLEPSGSIGMNSRFILTDLNLEEPANGLIARWLKLSMPLDTAVGFVQTADGSITLPVNLQLDPKHISYADVSVAAAGAVASVIANAVAAAPMKGINGVGSIVGLGSTKASEELSTIIAYPPGSAAMGAEQSAALAPLLKHLKDDPSLTVALKGELGIGDVKLSAARANPTREQSASIESSLRARKAQLLALRGDTAGRARAQLVSRGSAGAEGVLTQLRAIDRELAATEESLDQVGDLFKPGAEKQADRRTRAACLQIAAERLSELKKAILAAGISADRINSSAAKFNPAEDQEGGRITITVVKKK